MQYEWIKIKQWQQHELKRGALSVIGTVATTSLTLEIVCVLLLVSFLDLEYVALLGCSGRFKCGDTNCSIGICIAESRACRLPLLLEQLLLGKDHILGGYIAIRVQTVVHTGVSVAVSNCTFAVSTQWWCASALGDACSVCWIK